MNQPETCQNCPNHGHGHCCHDDRPSRNQTLLERAAAGEFDGYRVGDVHPSTRTDALAIAKDQELRQEDGQV